MSFRSAAYTATLFAVLACGSVTPTESSPALGVTIPGGTFRMGCVPGDTRCEPAEHPQHAVRISQAYGLDAREITVGEYRRFVRESGYVPASTRAGRGRMWDAAQNEWRWIDGLDWEHPLHPDSLAPDDWPVVQIDVRDAERFCLARGGRLPTEAEWEYAARGGRDGEIVPWVADGRPHENAPDRRLHARINAWEYDSTTDDGAATMAPVGSFPANGFGLHDMLGNVYEWTADAFADGPYEPSDSLDPIGATPNGTRVIRGGSWGYYPFHHRSSWRGVFESRDIWTATIGARCAYDRERPVAHRLWHGLRPGPHAIGVRTLAVDSAGADSIPVTVWYPAERSTPARAPLAFGAYVRRFLPTPLDSTPNTAVDDTTLRTRYARSWFPKADLTRVDHLLLQRTASEIGASPASGRWPVILYAPGLGGSPLTHTPTLEWLASQGFVVVAVTTRGSAGGEQSYDVAGQERLVGDLLRAARAVRQLTFVDSTRWASAGFSFGANAALRLADELPSIKAVVSLDGAVDFPEGVAILRATPGFELARSRPPLLMIYSKTDRNLDFSIINAMGSTPTWQLAIPNLAHHSVIATDLIAAVVTDSLARRGWEHYQLSTRVMCAFLSLTLGPSHEPRSDATVSATLRDIVERALVRSSEPASLIAPSRH